MSSSTPPPSKLLSVLSLLDAYAQVHEKGQNDQKACTWQLTVARHNKGRHGALINGVLLADDVREELRAIKVLKNPRNVDEPSLLDEDTNQEDDDGIKKMQSTTKFKETIALQKLERIFVMGDAMERKDNKKSGEYKEDDKSNSGDHTNADTGLRRRKGGGGGGDGGDNNKQKWSVEEVVAHEEEKLEEERLRNANPLDLFGAMPPKELRKAQQEALKALECYVEAANIIAAIQEQMK